VSGRLSDGERVALPLSLFSRPDRPGVGFLENAPADGAGCDAEPRAVLRMSRSVPVTAADPNPLSRRGFMPSAEACGSGAAGWKRKGA